MRHKFVDTNILLRIITEDIPELAEKAYAMLESCPVGGAYVSESVVDEICFVLQFNDLYKLSHQEIAENLLIVLNDSHIACHQDVVRAVALYGQNPKLDFVDCLLAVKADMKRENVLTFDKDLQNILT